MTVNEAKKCLKLICHKLKLTVEISVSRYDVLCSGELELTNSHEIDKCGFTIPRAELSKNHHTLYTKEARRDGNSHVMSFSCSTLNETLKELCEKASGCRLCTMDNPNDEIVIPKFDSYEELKLKLTINGN